MPKCKNPECRNGSTPGVKVIPKPKPQIGQTMKWAWVPCPLCHPDPKFSFKPLKRSEEEMEARADLADRGAPYVKESPSSRLARVAPQDREETPARVNGSIHAPAHAPPPPPAADPSVLANLSAALSNALAQIAAKDAEIAALRKQIAELTTPIPFGSSQLDIGHGG